MLTATRINLDYHGVIALRDASIEIAEHEIVSLVGANGAGKSSLLAAISGLRRPVHGRITFNGTDVSTLPAHAIARLGVALVPEGRRLFGHQSVLANLNLGAYRHGRDPLGRADTLRQVLELFPALGERLGKPAKVLSGGEQQMLALGRALMSRPTLLLLDEPSLGIAPKVARLIFDAIRRIRDQGVTVLLVEQNLAAALHLADRLYVLQTGSVVLSGTPAELENSPLIRRAYLGLG